MLTYIATSPDREDEAREAMLAELERVDADALFESGVERARNYAAGLVQVRRQRAASWGGELLEGWLHGKLGQLATQPERLRAVRAEQVARAAGEIFQRRRRAEYVVRGTGKTR
ncbi:MAG: hypothetical protein A2W29_09045 [Gemmatimonadetes bacterium RBG_16_66_8]|nr:MAG: hypothetical protein A2W29_09045 [Gemmatimonadetes bacterium RBG_16_66_8]